MLSDVFKYKDREARRAVLDRYNISKEDKNEFLNSMNEGEGDSGNGVNSSITMRYLNGVDANRFYVSIDFNNKTAFWYNYNKSIKEYTPIDIIENKEEYNGVNWTMYNINLIVPIIFTTWALKHSFGFYATNQHNLSHKYNAVYLNGVQYSLTQIATTPENNGMVIADNSFSTYDEDAKSVTMEVVLYQSDIEATSYYIKCQYHTLE